ncbi:MAG TPA: helix-turn-helix domain-containing protein [Candidatus Methylomirabilis sp.]|nr:helix-turn-helix domain-containing protein [Candidatus Methylomirabilis sp.]
MRSRRDVQNSNRHNETKAPLLFCIAKARGHYLTTKEISDITGLSHYNVSRQMTKLTGQGYVWRKNTGKKGYRYGFLKKMGERVCKELWIRMKLIETTKDDDIPLNLKKVIQLKHTGKLDEIEQEYNEWLFSK